jgi:hypothetical protein
MAETINEQIAAWINDAIDGQADPDATFTLRAVRPKILDWDEAKFQHADVLIELVSIETQSKTTVQSRTELGTWLLTGIIRELPDNTAADTIATRMAKTIQALMLAGNVAGQACGGLALNVACPKIVFGAGRGFVGAEVTVTIKYQTALADGYAGPN